MPGVGEDAEDTVPNMGEPIAKIDKMSKTVEVYDSNESPEYDESTGEIKVSQGHSTP